MKRQVQSVPGISQSASSSNEELAFVLFIISGSHQWPNGSAGTKSVRLLLLPSLSLLSSSVECSMLKCLLPRETRRF